MQNCVQEVRKKGRTEETNERTNERTKGVNESVKYWMSEWRNEFFFSRPLVHLADCERYCVLLYHLSGASFRCQNRTHNSDWVSVSSRVAEISVYGGVSPFKGFYWVCDVKRLCVASSALSGNLSSIRYLCIECRQPKPIKAEHISRCGDVFSIQTLHPGNPRCPSSSSFAYVWVTFLKFLLLFFFFLKMKLVGLSIRRLCLE